MTWSRLPWFRSAPLLQCHFIWSAVLCTIFKNRRINQTPNSKIVAKIVEHTSLLYCSLVFVVCCFLILMSANRLMLCCSMLPLCSPLIRHFFDYNRIFSEDFVRLSWVRWPTFCLISFWMSKVPKIQNM